MTLRLDYFSRAPQAIAILMQQEAYLKEAFSDSEHLPIQTWELLKLRVSQLNQCAFCIDMHTKDALTKGESFERLIGLSAWRDMPLYTERERVVLAWAETLTLNQGVDQLEFTNAVNLLGEAEVVNLTIAVNAINSWNRVAKTFKPEVGSYKPQ